jgi:hypothetical protein
MLAKMKELCRRNLRRECPEFKGNDFLTWPLTPNAVRLHIQDAPLNELAAGLGQLLVATTCSGMLYR